MELFYNTVECATIFHKEVKKSLLYIAENECNIVTLPFWHQFCTMVYVLKFISNL
nr:MAG TPA: hypothetical protein [Caudoviricetes sp.]